MTDIQLIDYILAQDDFENEVKVTPSSIQGKCRWAEISSDTVVRVQKDTNNRLSYISKRRFVFEREEYRRDPTTGKDE